MSLTFCLQISYRLWSILRTRTNNSVNKIRTFDKKNPSGLILLILCSCKRPDHKGRLIVDQLLDFVKADYKLFSIFVYRNKLFFGVDFDSNVSQVTFEQAITDKTNQVFKSVFCFV